MHRQNNNNCRQILKRLMFRLFYFHTATCFNLLRSPGGFYELQMLLLNY
jgi:hypothetical protein